MIRRSVALLIESSNAYARGLLHGIIEYQRQHDNWSVYLPELDRGATPPKWIKTWKGDGIIARIETDEIAHIVQRLDVPIVDVSAARKLDQIPWVETDDAKVSQLAVEHLTERGFRHFAFCGVESFNWSKWRCRHFLELLADLGHTGHSFESEAGLRRNTTWPSEKPRLAKWLKSLPKPIGIMASHDIRARQVLEACRELDILVPDEVAVVGVDNDPIVCNLAFPSLTSIIPDALGAGYRAAELLDRMISGNRVNPDASLLPPLGIATRQSTDIFAVEDEDIRRAAKFIREHACSGITVLDVLKEIPLSRRVLESRFRKATGRTPHDAILSHRMRRVEQLLRESDMSLDTIAAKTGFEHSEYMNVAFRRQFKVSPGRYRNRIKLEAGTRLST